jgi:cysteine desulfurase/selenocysteine lyase
MVLDSCAEQTRYKAAPHRFEAGTPNIGGVIALGAALGYIESIGLENVRTHERALTGYALKKLRETFGDTIQIIGPKHAKDRSGIIAFSFGSIYPASQKTTKIAPKNNASETSSAKPWCGVHPHDIAHLLGERNICVRAGEHCAAPLHRALHLDATTRLSLSIYNDESDIEKFIEALQEIQKIFSQ